MFAGFIIDLTLPIHRNFIPLSNFKNFLNSNVLLTGHTGFKGSWLTAWLKELGAQVTGVALNLLTNPSHFVTARLEGIHDLRIGLRDPKAVKQVLQIVQPEFVFHLAVQPLVRQSYADPVSTYAINLMGTLHFFEALRYLGRPCLAVLKYKSVLFAMLDADTGLCVPQAHARRL